MWQICLWRGVICIKGRHGFIRRYCIWRLSVNGGIACWFVIKWSYCRRQRRLGMRWLIMRLIWQRRLPRYYPSLIKSEWQTGIWQHINQLLVKEVQMLYWHISVLGKRVGNILLIMMLMMRWNYGKRLRRRVHRLLLPVCMNWRPIPKRYARVYYWGGVGRVFMKRSRVIFGTRTYSHPRDLNIL